MKLWCHVTGSDVIGPEVTNLPLSEIRSHTVHILKWHNCLKYFSQKAFPLLKKHKRSKSLLPKNTRLVFSKTICLGLLEFHLGLHLGLAELCLRQIFSREAETVYKTWSSLLKMCIRLAVSNHAQDVPTVGNVTIPFKKQPNSDYPIFSSLNSKKIYTWNLELKFFHLDSQPSSISYSLCMMLRNQFKVRHYSFLHCTWNYMPHITL